MKTLIKNLVQVVHIKNWSIQRGMLLSIFILPLILGVGNWFIIKNVQKNKGQNIENLDQIRNLSEGTEDLFRNQLPLWQQLASQQLLSQKLHLEVVRFVLGDEAKTEGLKTYMTQLKAQQETVASSLQRVELDEESHKNLRRNLIKLEAIILKLGTVADNEALTSLGQEARATVEIITLNVGNLKQALEEKIASINKVVLDSAASVAGNEEALAKSSTWLLSLTLILTGAAVGFIVIFQAMFYFFLKKKLGELDTLANNVSQSARQLSSSSQKQNGAVENITASLEELISSIQDVAKHANDVALNANNSSERAKAGGQVIQQSIESMQRISDSTNKITEIIVVMSGIAEQTNLLALNAAIEAARAGDEGKGFAVVADEVRKLAERSAHAAHEISGLIKVCCDRVEEGGTLSNNTGNTLSTIIENVKQTAEMIEQISASTEEQAATSNSIKDSMLEIAMEVETNTNFSKDLAHSAQYMRSEIQRTIKGGRVPNDEDSEVPSFALQTLA
ncbi:methyl-accepting chemotaxis protein [Deltaproteobacteria bacterium TL4]